MLERYTAFLKGTRNINDRTVANHLVLIRSVFNQTINDQILHLKFYPFGKGKVKIKFPVSGKVGLTQDEVKRIEDADMKEGKTAQEIYGCFILPEK